MVDMINSLQQYGTGLQLERGNSTANNTTETRGDYGTIALVTAGENTCPYSHLAKNGIIEYNGVTFMCDYKHNAITLGDVTSDPSKVLNIPLPSGGSLKVNVDNLGDLSKAAGMFSPKDLNAILRAIQTYKHCTSKIKEIEDDENKSPEELAQTRAEQERKVAAEQMKMINESIYQKLMSKDAISDMNSGIILDYEDRLSAEELERRIEMLFEDWDVVKEKLNI